MTDGITPAEHTVSSPAPAPAGPTSPANTPSPASPASHTEPASPASNIVRISLAGLNSTGDPRVDETVARLGELDGAPLDEHPVILGQVHDRLREVLGELSPGDSQPASGTP
jgi:hypothetical protein